MQNQIGVETMMHLTCTNMPADKIDEALEAAKKAGLTNILALRGDPPQGPGAVWTPHPEGLTQAIDLVELIASLGDFSIGVAAFPEGHPESPSREHDAHVLRLKQEAGADFAITQLFFQVEDYLRLRDLAAQQGCTMPIVPGIMPVTNVAQIERFATLSGAAFPEALADRFRAVDGDADAVSALGVEVATQMCAELLAEGAPGLHFYTLNRSRSTMAVYAALGLSDLIAR
jgi:methylenetetrahydrofolate reductase (NADPH)